MNKIQIKINIYFFYNDTNSGSYFANLSSPSVIGLNKFYDETFKDDVYYKPLLKNSIDTPSVVRESNIISDNRVCNKVGNEYLIHFNLIINDSIIPTSSNAIKIADIQGLENYGMVILNSLQY